jgi:hypothetical protein
MAKKSEEFKINYTLIAVFTEDEIIHKTFESLEEVNKFVETELEGKSKALVFVVEGKLMPESQWRLSDEKETYWVVI